MLTPKREAFAAGLARGMSQAAAYRAAFPSSLKWRDEVVWSKASTLAADGMVQERVQELCQRAAAANQVTVERVVAEFARLAFSSPKALFNQDGSPKRITDLSDDEAAAVAGFEVVSVGNAVIGEGQVVKVKLADKRAALADLGRHLKMFVDKIELKVDESLAERLARARARANAKG